MRTALACAAVAGAVLLSATVAVAQQHPGMQGPAALSAEHAYRGGYNEYHGSWNGRGADNGHSAHGHFTARVAREQLNAFGFTHIHKLERAQGWEAEADKDGRPVHVMINDKDEVAVFRGE